MTDDNLLNSLGLLFDLIGFALLFLLVDKKFVRSGERPMWGKDPGLLEMMILLFILLGFYLQILGNLLEDLLCQEVNYPLIIGLVVSFAGCALFVCERIRYCQRSNEVETSESKNNERKRPNLFCMRR